MTLPSILSLTSSPPLATLIAAILAILAVRGEVAVASKAAAAAPLPFFWGQAEAAGSDDPSSSSGVAGTLSTPLVISPIIFPYVDQVVIIVGYWYCSFSLCHTYQEVGITMVGACGMVHATW